MLKRCADCKELKERDDNFSFSDAGPRRFYCGRCKQCDTAYAYKKIYQLPVEERRELWRKARKRSNEKNPEKTLARALVATAIRKGELKRSPCEICGEGKSQAHHDDYTRPLDIRWLCHLHHREHHYKDKQAVLQGRKLTPPPSPEKTTVVE